MKAASPSQSLGFHAHDARLPLLHHMLISLTQQPVPRPIESKRKHDAPAPPCAALNYQAGRARPLKLRKDLAVSPIPDAKSAPARPCHNREQRQLHSRIMACRRQADHCNPVREEFRQPALIAEERPRRPPRPMEEEFAPDQSPMNTNRESRRRSSAARRRIARRARRSPQGI